MQEQYVAHLITFGLGGHGVDCTRVWKSGQRTKPRISGYDRPESFEKQLTTGQKPDYPPLAGVPVLDKRAALETNHAYAFKSPLVDPELKDGEVDRLDAAAASCMLPGLSGEFEQLATLAVVHQASGRTEPGPLDHVSLAEYVAWWTERGARLGHMDETGTAIIWEQS